MTEHKDEVGRDGNLGTCGHTEMDEIHAANVERHCTISMVRINPPGILTSNANRRSDAITLKLIMLVTAADIGKCTQD